MSSDEKSDFDENISEQEADSELRETLYGEPNNKILQNEDEALTSEDEQSDDGDKEANEPVQTDNFIDNTKNMLCQISQHLLMKSTMT